jgi:hypothetical protein
MNQALQDMLESYQPTTPTDYQNASREVNQEIALLGLWLIARNLLFNPSAFLSSLGRGRRGQRSHRHPARQGKSEGRRLARG